MWIDRALAMDPNLVTGHYQKGLILAEAGHLEAASVELEQALDINPYYLDAILALGKVRDDQGQPMEAARLYQRALAGDPGNRQAVLGLVETARSASSRTQIHGSNTR